MFTSDRPQVQVRRERLLNMRVSAIIAAHDDALAVLIDGGFEPLANQVMRRALAGTVNLDQALRIRNLADSAAESVIQALLELGVDQHGGDDAAA